MPQCWPDGFTAISFPPGLGGSPLLYDGRYSSACIPTLTDQDNKYFHVHQVPRQSSPQLHLIPNHAATKSTTPSKTRSIRKAYQPTTMTVIHIGK
jgi:hypothetical protein